MRPVTIGDGVFTEGGASGLPIIVATGHNQNVSPRMGEQNNQEICVNDVTDVNPIRDPQRFLDLLRDQHTWPGTYMFKVIVESDRSDEAWEILRVGQLEVRSSQGGKYRSLTGQIFMQGPEEVLQIYEKLQKIEGAICL